MLARVALTLAVLSAGTVAAGPKKVKAQAIAESVHPIYTAPSIAALAPQPVTTTEATVATDPFQVVHETALNLKVAHEFSRDLARERVSQLLAYWDERFGVKSEWHGFRVFLTGKVLGIAIKALFEVEDGAVVAMAEDPGTILSGTARRYVDSKLHKYLSPNYQEP